MITSLVLLAMLFLIQARMPLAFLATWAHCWLILSRLLTNTPSTEPWGTLLVTGCQLDLTPFTTTLWAQPSSQFFTQRRLAQILLTVPVWQPLRNGLTKLLQSMLISAICSWLPSKWMLKHEITIRAKFRRYEGKTPTEVTKLPQKSVAILHGKGHQDLSHCNEGPDLSGTMPARPSTYPDMGAQWEFQMLHVEDGKRGQQLAKMQEAQHMDTRQDPNIAESLLGRWLRSVSLG
ncbi:hypothetical protein QYF61_018239 [Mycteria americana]|uniref:Uncharacterized protein n=1 Tax=Mycteria americana TaxID=33587 RepID=A0AAN7NB10_MYCAM|nr:hypothetical protein QYF61_018239 [Mycteria americana]